MSKRLGLTFIFFTTFFWAVVPLISKYTLSYVSPFTLAGVSYGASAVTIFVLSMVLDRKGLFDALRKFRVLIVLSGIVLGSQYVIFMSGLDLTTAVAAQIIVQTEGIYFVIWGFIFFHEKITRKKALGIAMAALGVFVVSWNGEDLSVLVSSEYFVGNMMILLVAILFSVYMAFQKKLSDQGTSFSTLFPMFLIASFILFWLIPKEEALALQPIVFGILVMIGVFIALSYLFFIESMKYIMTSSISVMILSAPVLTFSIVAAGKVLHIPFFEGEHLTAFILLGGAAIIFGAFMVISEEK